MLGVVSKIWLPGSRTPAAQRRKWKDHLCNVVLVVFLSAIFIMVCLLCAACSTHDGVADTFLDIPPHLSRWAAKFAKHRNWVILKL